MNHSGRSIRPGVPVPATVLLREMGGGALFLQGWRGRTRCLRLRAGCALLRQGLASAFGTEPGSDTPATS